MDGIDWADLQADVAPGAKRVLDDMMVVGVHRDGVSRAVLGAAGAAKAGVGDVVPDKRNAFF